MERNKNVTAPEALLSADEVARWLRVDRLRVYELARSGQLPRVRLGRTFRFDPVAVRAWLAAGGTDGNGKS